MPATGPDLVLAARLRSEIATLARGGEYRLAGSLLLDLAAVDLRVGLRADALLRTRQASKLAQETGDLAEELRAELVLAMAQISAGEPEQAEKTADSVLYRTTTLEADIRPHLVSSAYLVRGMASRRAHNSDAARVALGQCRERSARVGRADLAALALTELGWIDRAAGDAAAAGLCFWFARDAFRLTHRAKEARAVELLALAAFIDGGRVDEAVALASDAIYDADGRGDPETAARAAGILADALLARGDEASAKLAAAEAATRVNGLPEAAARELGVGARLRQVRLEHEPTQRVRHLEAALDLGLSARDAVQLARVLDVAVGGLLEGTLPLDTWRVVTELARSSRELGLARVADIADAALAELR